MLRRAGFRSGIADYFLPVPIIQADSAGLWLELKRSVRSASRTSNEQTVFLDDMRALGYLTVIAYGAESAERHITEYLAYSGDRVTVGYGEQLNAQAIAFAKTWYDRRERAGEL